MSTIRPLTEAEDLELAALNEAVNAALRARRDWLDAKMAECSALQPGDDIYDIRKGYKVGTVRKLYRFHRDRDEGIRDRSHYCSYEYETSPRCYDNTSRQVGVSFGTKADAADYARARLNALIR